MFYVREAAIMVLGRLTQLNPAHVMPALRRMLVQVCVCVCLYVCVYIYRQQLNPAHVMPALRRMLVQVS